ncbi:MAG: tetratricopeptide repeat protein, partial [Silvibacterium sp.]|nr:tetratricopeptide repeat protein [Silvibacterium sp.]
ETTFREVFHGTSRAQWPQVAQNISQRMGFGGSVTNLDVSLPEQTDKPFHYAYDYSHKEYADWNNRRIVPLTFPVSLTEIDQDETPTEPIQLGSPRTETHKSTIELPQNYTAQLPRSVKYTTPFAVYQADYKLDGNKLITERKLEILEREVPVDKAAEYKKLAKNVTDDEGQFIQLVAAGTKGVDTAAGNPEAQQFLQSAYVDITRHDYKAAHSDLHSAEQLNPKERGLWMEAGYLDMMENRLDDAITDFKKEIEYHPENALAYEAMAELLVKMKRNEDAERTLRDLLKVIPDNTNAELQLGSLLILDKKYDEASALLETAMKQAPDNKNIAAQAGRAELLAGKREAGIATLSNSMKGSDDPDALNNAAYELADFNADLANAEAASKKAMGILEKQTAEISLGNLTRDDLAHINLLTAVWDTMGWIYYREGKLPEAENYVSAAWTVTQHSEVGDHMGQIYEKQGKLEAAAKTWELALSAETLSPDPSGTESIRQNLAKLEGKGIKSDGKAASEQLAQMRTLSISKRWKGGSADFFVLISSEKTEDAQFIGGDEQLKDAAADLMKLKITGQIPKGSQAKLVRRGTLYCPDAGDSCTFTMLLPQSTGIN